MGMEVRVRVRVRVPGSLLGYHCCSFPELIAGFRVRFKRETEPSSL